MSAHLGGPPSLALEGAVTRKAYRVGRGALTVAQVLAPAWETLAAAGFEEVYTCRAADCGGFDFRFALDILGAPAMHVDLGDYVYRLGRRGEEAVALVASRSAAAGFLHVTHVVPGAGAPPAGPVAEAAGDTALELPPAVSFGGGESASSAPGPGPAAPREALAARLEDRGHAVLDGVDFASGSDALGSGGDEALGRLAAWMEADPARRITLVGHTDAVGELAPNISLSRSRAAAVARRLTDTFGIAAERVTADGVGWLAPIATNATEEGRAANRRVEAVVTTP